MASDPRVTSPALRSWRTTKDRVCENGFSPSKELLSLVLVIPFDVPITASSRAAWAFDQRRQEVRRDDVDWDDLRSGVDAGIVDDGIHVADAGRPQVVVVL